MAKMYYVRYIDDNPAEDGIWLDTQNRDQFFLREEAAIAECERRNLNEEIRHTANQKLALMKWEQVEAASRAVSESSNISPRAVFPHHPESFKYPSFRPKFVVDTLEIVD